MKHTNCLHCGAELIHLEGRKAKKYCSDNCRQKSYQAAKYLLRPVKPPKNEEPDPDASIRQQIALIKAEPVPPERNKTAFGRLSWKLDQTKRIEELESKLKN